MNLLHSEHSLDFNGSSSYISIGDVIELSFDIDDAFSFSQWVKFETNGYLISKFNNLAGQDGWGVYAVGGRVQLILIDAANQIRVETLNVVLQSGEWHHVVTTYDGSEDASGINIIVDGEAVALNVVTNNTVLSLLTTAEVRIGSRVGGTFFGGGLDEVAVYNKELSLSEAITIYSSGTPRDLSLVGPTGNVVGYWPLGDGDTFPTVIDHSPSGNNGTMTSMVAGDIVIDAPRAKTSYYSMLFGGVNEYVSIGTFSEYQFERTDAFSVSFWVKTQNIVGGAILSNLNSATSFRGWEISYWPDGVIGVQLVSSTSSNDIDVQATPVINTGEWLHVVMTYNGSSSATGVNFYFDGTAVATSTIRDNLTATMVSTANLRLMARADNTAFVQGTALDEVTIWTKELSVLEVATLYNKGQPPDARTIGLNTLLVGYWEMGDSGTFPTIPDLSSSGHDGTAVNMEITDIKFDAPGISFQRPEISAYSIDWANQNIPGYVDIGTPAELAFERTQAFSISAWVKYTGGGTIIGNLENTSGLRGWELYIDPPYGDINFFLCSDDDTNDEIYIYSDNRYDDGEWHHFCVVYLGDSDPDTVTIYVDGVSAPFTSDVDNLTGTTVSTENVKIGKTSAESASYDGLMDEVSVWNKALSEVEVRTIFNSRRPTSLFGSMPIANLKGYWQMGDNTTFPNIPDLSSLGNDGVMVGYLHKNYINNERPPSAPSTQYSLGIGGRYDATDPLLDFAKADSFSLACWFRTDSVNTSFPTLISHQTPVGYVVEMQGNGGENPGGVMFSAFGPTNTFRVSTDTAYNDGVWRHLVITYNGSGLGTGITFYINGSPVASTVHEDALGAEDFYAVTPYRIYDALITGQGYIGSTAQHAVYDKELASGEVTTIYGAAVPPNLNSVGPTGNLVAWWPILEADLPSLPNLPDYGPNDITMVSWSGNTSIVAQSPSQFISRYSVEFDGTNDEVDVGNISVLSFERTDPWSISIWIRVGVSGQFEAFVSKMDISGAFRGWYFGLDTSGQLIFTLRSTSSTNEIYVFVPGSITDSVWKNVIATYDGSSSSSGVRIYIDGTQQTLSVTSNNLSATTITTASVKFGRHGTTYYAGFLDNIAVYNRVLSPSEAFLLGGQDEPIDHGAIGPIDSVVGWWRMGDPFGPSSYPTIGDASAAHQNPGTMTNMSSGDIVQNIKTADNYFMRALADPGPGYLKWSSNSIDPDYAGAGAGGAIQAGSAISLFSFSHRPKTYHMRALIDPGPGYTNWKSGRIPDYSGNLADDPIQVGSAVVIHISQFDSRIPSP